MHTRNNYFWSLLVNPVIWCYKLNIFDSKVGAFLAVGILKVFRINDFYQVSQRRKWRFLQLNIRIFRSSSPEVSSAAPSSIIGHDLDVGVLIKKKSRPQDSHYQSGRLGSSAMVGFMPLHHFSYFWWILGGLQELDHVNATFGPPIAYLSYHMRWGAIGRAIGPTLDMYYSSMKSAVHSIVTLASERPLQPNEGQWAMSWPNQMARLKRGCGRPITFIQQEKTSPHHSCYARRNKASYRYRGCLTACNTIVLTYLMNVIADSGCVLVAWYTDPYGYIYDGFHFLMLVTIKHSW